MTQHLYLTGSHPAASRDGATGPAGTNSAGTNSAATTGTATGITRPAAATGTTTPAAATGTTGPVAVIGTTGTAGTTAEVSCHHLLGGPYTGLGAALRVLMPSALTVDQALVRQHAVEILAVAPDLAGLVGEAPATLTSSAPVKEQTRIYPAARTGRIANGVVDFLLACAAPSRLGPRTLSFTRVDQADQTDQEFISILLRRARPDQVRVVVSAGGRELPPELATALDRYARPVGLTEPVEPVGLTEPLEPAGLAGPDGSARDRATLLRAYVDADGTSCDPAEIAAYHAADPDERAALHDARAASLMSVGDKSPRLGAIPYHLEHGSDPAGAGGAALLEALIYCFLEGYYHAAIDFGRRGRAVTDPATQLEQYWQLSGRTSSSHMVLGRLDEAESIIAELRCLSARPDIHIVTGYSLSMLYTRHFPPERRNHQLAKAYINNAIALSSLSPDPHERTFQVVFNENGLALIEMHLGNLPEAIRLVTDGRARLDRELPPDAYLLHRSVLVHNRANVLSAAGHLEEALADFDKVVEMDPNYAEYYLDRATVRRRLGDDDGALADYDTAIARTFPLWELHYNRGDLRIERGDVEGAIADFERVLELDPDQLDARINLADLLIETGRLAEADDLIGQGLLVAPGDGQLLCARGRLAVEAGDAARARREFDLALTADGQLVAALAGRAALAYEAGDLGAAVEDLTRAIEVDTDPDLLYNRGLVHQEAGHWQAAIDDFTAALLLPGADQDELLRQQAACRGELAGAGSRTAVLQATRGQL